MLYKGRGEGMEIAKIKLSEKDEIKKNCRSELIGECSGQALK